MKSVVHTPPQAGASRLQIDDKLSVNHQLETINKIATDIVRPGEEMKQTGKLDNGTLMLAGEHGGFEVKGDRSVVHAAPGSTVKKQVVVTGKTMLSGATLSCDGNTPAVLVKDGGRLVMSDCHITKDDNRQALATDTYISIATGGYATLRGCIFYGSQTDTGALVHNDDPLNPNRVAVVGCMNLTDVVTTPFVNVLPANVVGVVP